MFLREGSQKYKDQIDLILDNPNERNLALTISIDDLHAFECGSIAEFKEYVLERFIQKAAIRRDLDFESTLKLVYSRLKLEEICL